LRVPQVNGDTTDRENVLREMSTLLTTTRVIGIGSPRASLQSNFALKTLVGKDNFFHGVSDNEHNLAKLVIKILKNGPVRTPSLKEIESADAVFILGEDLTNTAPMMALAVRQSARQQPLEAVSKLNIPLWNDAAARELIQDKHGPVYIATANTTKLDDIATETFRAAPEEIARLGFAVAHILDNAVPDVTNLSESSRQLATKIAASLSAARRPLIISGASCEIQHVIKAAANVAWALHKKNKDTGLAFTLPESNSMGLAMMGGHRLETAFNAVLHHHADTVIILENDLYRHGSKKLVDQFLSQCKNVVVLDHSNNPTTQKARVLIPAGTFAESDGVIVNNEGRAQRYYQVYEATDVIQESWRWLLNIGKASGHQQLSNWKNYTDVTHAISVDEPFLMGIEKVSVPDNYRINGQRIPRESHRFSGRTAMLANINVSEPKPPEDSDSPLSYTMEGYRGLPPSSMIPFVWSPGWNSTQATNKYQQEVGGHLRDGDPGMRLLEPSQSGVFEYFTSVPEIFLAVEDHFWVVHLHHIFGSEELSSAAQGIIERSPTAYLMINAEDAGMLQLQENHLLPIEVDGQPYNLPVKISASIPKGIAGLPYGLPGLPFVELPAWGIIKQHNFEMVTSKI